MWLIIISFAAAITTAIWYVFDNGKYKLSLLSLILWGSAIMIFVDHAMGYIEEGGEFIETTLNATLLGIVLLIVAIMIWELVLLWSDPKKKLKAGS
ncbi:MAG: hypothetical protein FE045_03030 [Thermoplasmata archaeon]|nr:MAG: hypothetical protein FE045_03030 [Thermoplasmata archaeon]MCD6222382.1 hypothetical protein [Thermoplasmata archaeon]